ncbi:MAG: dockerin type I repeat-containing protein [Muribaculaceae bacterium]|nr:dockerin type I repeat-containing protein [Muribaculaceae bacterium]
MNRFFTLLMVMVALLPSAQTLDLYDGKAYDFFVPINSQWYDVVGAQSQAIYPAQDLVPLMGKEITSMTFYTDQNGCNMNGGLLEIYLGEPEGDLEDDFITEGLTLVGGATMVRSARTDSAMVTLTFDTPYAYQGGNLLLSTVVAGAGTFGLTYFMGVSTTYNSCIATGYNRLVHHQFLPHTTFAYRDAQPAGVRGDVDGDGRVNVDDLTALIDLMLSSATSQAAPGADCDGNGTVNIDDLTALIDYLLVGVWPAR